MKKKTLFKLLPAAFAAIVLTACTLPGTSEEPVVEDLAYATIEINPGLGVMVDEDYRIAFAHALNGDGEMVMLQLQLDGKTLDEAIDDIVEETVDLDFINGQTVDPGVDIDVTSNKEMLKEQVRTQTQTRVSNAFTGHMITVQTHTRVYSQDEIDEADAKDVTPLQLRLVKQAMIGNDDLLEEEALDLEPQALLAQVKNGATNMKKIAATLGAEFLEARQLIQDTYRPQIQALKADIEAAILAGEDTTALEEQLTTLREAMVAEIQLLVAEYRQQTVQAREQWQSEAEIRKGGSTSQPTSQISGPSTSV